MIAQIEKKEEEKTMHKPHTAGKSKVFKSNSNLNPIIYF